MKRCEKIANQIQDYFFQGYEQGKKDIVKKILKFVDEESEFIPDIHSDTLLDRLVKFVKDI